MAPWIGISLQADEHFLVLNRELIEDHVDVYEINPETLWDQGAEPGPLHPAFVEIVTRSNRPTIGHGILYSLGAAKPPARRRIWLDALERDQQVFGFEWYSEHLGFADADGCHVALPLPLPLPPDDETVQTVCNNLQPLRDIFPSLAFENNVGYFALGDPMAEPELFQEICRQSGCRMVLDLHNAYSTCLNFGLDLGTWLDRVPWESVIEIHLSGGCMTDQEWFQGRPFRLDTHDQPVPEPVWEAFEQALPRSPNLRAVIVEWMPDGMDKAAAAAFLGDVDRARSMAC